MSSSTWSRGATANDSLHRDSGRTAPAWSGSPARRCTGPRGWWPPVVGRDSAWSSAHRSVADPGNSRSSRRSARRARPGRTCGVGPQRGQTTGSVCRHERRGPRHCAPTRSHFVRGGRCADLLHRVEDGHRSPCPRRSEVDAALRPTGPAMPGRRISSSRPCLRSTTVAATGRLWDPTSADERVGPPLRDRGRWYDPHWEDSARLADRAGRCHYREDCSTSGGGELRLWVPMATAGADDHRAGDRGFRIDRDLFQLRCPLPLAGPVRMDPRRRSPPVPFRPGMDEAAWLVTRTTGPSPRTPNREAGTSPPCSTMRSRDVVRPGGVPALRGRRTVGRFRAGPRSTAATPPTSG